MKRIVISAILSAVTAGVMTGCSSKEEVLTLPPQTNECKIEGAEAPKWVCGKAKRKAYRIATGEAARSELGEGFARREALATARGALAQRIQAETKRKVRSFVLEHGIVPFEKAEKMAEKVAFEVARHALDSFEELDAWVSPSGRLYLLAGVPEPKVRDEVKRTLPVVIGNDRKAWDAYEASGGREALEAAF